MHKDDFEWASKQYEALDYIFIGFILDIDSYHWKAIYTKADNSQNPHSLSYAGSIER